MAVCKNLYYDSQTDITHTYSGTRISKWNVRKSWGKISVVCNIFCIIRGIFIVHNAVAKFGFCIRIDEFKILLFFLVSNRIKYLDKIKHSQLTRQRGNNLRLRRATYNSTLKLGRSLIIEINEHRPRKYNTIDTCTFMYKCAIKEIVGRTDETLYDHNDFII